MAHVNPWAVLVAAAVSFLFGAFWYSPVLFLEPWSLEAGVDADTPIDRPARVFGLTFVLTIVNALVLAAVLGPDPRFGVAVASGLAVGVCVAAASLGINYQFASRSVRFWAIDGGFHALRFALMGAVLGVWPG